MRTIALVSSDGLETSGIFSADESLTDDELSAEAAKYGFTLDFVTYASGGDVVDATVMTMPEFVNYVSTVQDQAR
jgi:hypothetical protein